MKKKTYLFAGLLTALLLLSGCDTVPESVMEANKSRMEETRKMTQSLMKARNENPQVSVAINLPPGTYNVPESGWELAKVDIYEPITAIGLKALDKSDWQISENVAITGLRVAAPLIGFLGGQYFTNEALKTSANALTSIGLGNTNLAESLGSQAIATGPSLGAPAE